MSQESANGVSRIGLCIDPLDVLFFRDGRPFDAASRAHGGLPLPRTLAGALRTALLASDGFDLGALRDPKRLDSDGPRPTTRQVLKEHGAPDWILDARFRGPWLALVDRDGSDGTIHPLLPVPATLARIKPDPGGGSGAWRRAQPCSDVLPGWRDPDLLPVWRKGDPDAKHPGGFLTREGIQAFLEGQTPEDSQWYEPDDLLGYDVRTGIGINADTLTSAESQIYGVRMLALKPSVEKKPRSGRPARVALYQEIILPAGAPARDEVTRRLAHPIPLGGEGRHASLGIVNPVAWPEMTRREGRCLWLLATPAIFGSRPGHPRADRPDAIEPAAQLRAAASGTPQAVSGWDIAMNGPRPTRFAVPAGAVYYVESAIEPRDRSLCINHELAAEGWGFALRGVWNDG